MTTVIGILAVLVCCGSANAAEDYQIEILPTVVVGQAYEDNIFLTRDNEKSDYITTVSPGVAMRVASTKTNLNLEYFPTFVWYNDFSENDTVRHNAKLNLVQRFTKYLSLDVRERYLRTEDPYLEVLDPVLRSQTVRNTRNPYYRNDASAAMNYQFGRRDTASVGFDYSLLENQDPSLDDIDYYGPNLSLTHWFDVQNGVELTYRYEVYDYDREDGRASRDDLTGHVGRARYLHQFNPRTRVFVGYGIYTRDFDGSRRDYEVHEGRAGIEHQLERDWKLTLEAGAFDATSGANGDGGALFTARVDKRVKRGSLMLGFDMGWDEGLLEPEGRGFTEYYGFTGGAEYQFLEKLFGSVQAWYRDNDRPQDAQGLSGDFTTIYGVAGLRYEIVKRIFMGLEYYYLDREADNNVDQFTDNRVLLTLSASHAFYPLGGRPPEERRPGVRGTAY